MLAEDLWTEALHQRSVCELIHRLGSLQHGPEAPLLTSNSTSFRQSCWARLLRLPLPFKLQGSRCLTLSKHAVQMRKPGGQAAGTNAQPWHPVHPAEQEQISNGQPELPSVPKARHPSRPEDQQRNHPLTFAADLMSRLNMDLDTQATLLVSPSLQLKGHG